MTVRRWDWDIMIPRWKERVTRLRMTHTDRSSRPIPSWSKTRSTRIRRSRSNTPLDIGRRGRTVPTTHCRSGTDGELFSSSSSFRLPTFHFVRGGSRLEGRV